MANNCYTTIRIWNVDADKTLELFNKIQQWLSVSYIGSENDSNKYWLGNIVGNSGIDNGKNKDGEYVGFTKCRCRGEIGYLEYSDDQILIETDTAWVPMLGMWMKIINKYLPGGELWYSAEEPGCEIYCTNDMTYAGTYEVDFFGEKDSMYEVDEGYLINFLADRYKAQSASLKELLEMASNDDSIAVSKWEYKSPGEWE